MEHSDFGKRFAGKIGIGELMDDLGNALVADPAPLMLGGGNPSHVPPVQARFRKRMEAILAQPGEFERVIGNYDTPQGAKLFIESLVELFRSEFGWKVGPGNFALTNGSQNSFFYLFNLFAGRFGETRRKQILLPLAPEYIGYSEVGLEKDFFQANRPEITRLANNLFKYQVDFDSLQINEQTGAVCFSRPTNPTGNVVTDEEVERLRRGETPRRPPHHRQCLRHALPQHHLRGRPAGLGRGRDRMHEPVQARPARLTHGHRDRTRGDHPDRIQDDFRVQPRPRGHGTGPALDLVKSGEITRISREVVRPFYEAKAKRAVAQLQRELEGLPLPSTNPRVPSFSGFGSKACPSARGNFTSASRKGRARGVRTLLLPRTRRDWPHKNECIRVTYAQDDEVVEKGLSLIASEIREIHSQA